MKTKIAKIEREFEVGDAFLHNDGKLNVVSHVDMDRQRVVFYATCASYGDFWWLNQILDAGDATYIGKLERCPTEIGV